MDYGFENRAALLSSLTAAFPDYGDLLVVRPDRSLRGIAFLRDLLPPWFFSDPEAARTTAASVMTSATLLGAVEERFGNDARFPVLHSGSQHRSVPMVNHHLGHSMDVVEGSVRYALRREQEDPGPTARPTSSTS